MDGDPGPIAHMDWATLYDRADAADVDVEDVRTVLARHRERAERSEGMGDTEPGAEPEQGAESDPGQGAESDPGQGAESDPGQGAESDPGQGAESDPEGGGTRDEEGGTEPPPDPSPARVVADADVLAADVLVGGPSREALEGVWRHSWIHLLASDQLLADAAATIAELSTPELAAAWRELVAEWREPVTHPVGDHSGLGSAYRGGAMHLLSFDRVLSSPRAGAELRGRVPLSVREPRAFATVFDAESLYLEVVGGEYPGPDRPPRA